MSIAIPNAGYFDTLFAQNDDPWRFGTSWYEARKRALTLACMPTPHYGSIFEPGCANGELSAALAARCNRLLALDGSSKATDLAKQRLADLPHAEVRQGFLPEAWPDDQFDLIVISEIAYYLNADQLSTTILQIRAALTPGGTVIACHWRHPIEGCEFNGDQVHALLHVGLGMQRLTTVTESDFRLDVWSLEEQSVARREGLV